MPPRWVDLPKDDWVALQRQLRALAKRVGESAILTASASTTLAPSTPFTTVLVDTSAGNVTLTLPPAADVAGYTLKIKKMTAANTLTIDGNGAETIDGAATLAVTVQYESNTLESTGTAWIIT